MDKDKKKKAEHAETQHDACESMGVSVSDNDAKKAADKHATTHTITDDGAGAIANVKRESFA